MTNLPEHERLWPELPQTYSMYEKAHRLGEALAYFEQIRRQVIGEIRLIDEQTLTVYDVLDMLPPLQNSDPGDETDHI